jgi:hypothetical protein
MTAAARFTQQRWVVAAVAAVLVLLIADVLAGNVVTASTVRAADGTGPVVDVPVSGAAAESHSGGQATRIELDDADLTATLSSWYRLAYLQGGAHLRVFEHYPAAIAQPDADMLGSEKVAWRLANTVVGRRGDLTEADPLPRWAQFRTGHDTGGSGGLMFALAYLDVLTPGALVGALRVAGTGGIGRDGAVFPVSNVEVKVDAAMLTRPDVVFTTRPPKQVDHVTIVDAQSSRHPTAGYTVGEWFNVTGYEDAGRLAASDPGTAAVVVVHDLRQALAWLCGRTELATVCAIAYRSATTPVEAA